MKRRYMVISAVNGAALIAALLLTIAGSSLAKSQRYNYAAERWTQGEGGCTQVSCFLADDSGFTRDSVISLRTSLLDALSSAAVYPEEGKTLCPDAYSSPVGRFQVTCDRTGSSQCDVTAVGGEFFLFRSFDLMCGSFISDRDLMRDGAVIDRTLAFRLCGSENIAGMSIYINGVQFRIAGVIGDPRTKYEGECAGDYPKAYIAYDMASKLTDSGEQFRRVSCYEVIVPDPVENFGYNAVEKLFSSYGDKAITVNNTGRFTSGVRVKAASELSRDGVRNEAIRLPYWENASRIVEHKLTVMYSIRRGVLIVPAITAIWLIVRLYRRLSKRIKRLAGFIPDRIYALRCRIAARRMKE